MEQVIGIDLAKRVFQLNIVSPLGKTIKNTVIMREKLTEFIAQQPPSKIVMEACGSANYWSRQFKRFGHEVKQISPQYVAPFRMGSKNDKNDAVAIVEADSLRECVMSRKKRRNNRIFSVCTGFASGS
ncbi:hypothetical protein [Xenorhabdus bovienii]|uniref:hypothetical protein n=1 Tax=Xenorhabdus bovienii TaxID=40576 RepID=UPI0023B355C5|nr:hypothetical protein [Xenorhabdus bovienii]